MCWRQWLNDTPYSCFKSSPQHQSLCPSSMVVSPHSIPLTLARPRMSHQWHFNSWVSSCTFLQACRGRTLHVPIVVPSFVNLTVVFAQSAHLSPPSVGWPVIVDPGLDWSGILFLCFVFPLVFSVGLGKSWGRGAHLLFKSPTPSNGS